VLDAGGFGLVVVYRCGLAAGRAPSSVWARLQQRAASSRAAVLLVGDRAQAGSFAAATLEARRGPSRFTDLFDGVDGDVRVIRCKRGRPGDVIALEHAVG
jgi:hypothetical protein